MVLSNISSRWYKLDLHTTYWTENRSEQQQSTRTPFAKDEGLTVKRSKGADVSHETSLRRYGGL